MIEVINFIIGIVLTIAMGFFAYMSSVLVSEKKARYRAGTHDYYDNPIKDSNEQSQESSIILNRYFSISSSIATSTR